jgi:transformation/transcription domain-associated protein
VQHCNGAYRRRIGMVGSNGRVTYFFVAFTVPHIARSDERMMQMYLMLNRMMEKSKETRKRNLAFHVPLTVPLQQRMQLQEVHPSMQTLEGIYEQSCAARGVDPMSPLLTFREIMSKVESPTETQAGMSPAALAGRLKWMDECSAASVPDWILSKHFAALVRSADQLWALKKEFAAQLALTGYLSYVMNIGERVPYKLGINRHSGRVIQSEFYPVYHDKSYVVDCNEPVPFRLTRTMTHFISPCMVGGLVSAVLTAVNTCLIGNQDTVKSYLSLFVRDDLSSFLSSKYPLMTDAEARAFEYNNKNKVSANMMAVLRRIHLLMPAPQPTGADKRNKLLLQQQQQQPQPVNNKVDDLLATAMSKKGLIQMPSIWFPML